MRRGTRTRNPQIRSLIRYPLRQPHIHTVTHMNFKHIYHAIQTLQTTHNIHYTVSHPHTLLLLALCYMCMLSTIPTIVYQHQYHYLNYDIILNILYMQIRVEHLYYSTHQYCILCYMYCDIAVTHIVHSTQVSNITASLYVDR